MVAPTLNSLDQLLAAARSRLTRLSPSDALDAIYADNIIFTGVTGAVCDKLSLMDEARRGVDERRRAR